MTDERASPSGGWREVYDEMGVDGSWEDDAPDTEGSAGGEERQLQAAICEVGPEAEAD